MSKPFAGVRILDFTRYLAGPVRHLPAGAARRRRGEDRVARRRRDAQPARLQGVGGPQDAARLPGRERQQAQHHARPAAAGGGRGRQAARRHGRRGVGELPARRDGQARARLRDARRRSTRGSSTARSPASATPGRRRRPPPSTASCRRCRGSCRSPASRPAARCARGSPSATPSAASPRRWRCRARSTSARTPAAASSSTWPCSTPRWPSSPGPVSEYTVAGIEQKQIGNGSVSRKPTANRFRAKDGFIVLAVLTEKQFVSLMKTIGRPDALDRPALQGLGGADGERGGAARGDRGRAGQRRSQDLGDAADRGRRAVRLHLEDRRDRRAPAARAPRRAADDRLALRPACGWSAPASGSPTAARASTASRPTLGEHTDEILAEAGYSKAEIETLRRDLVV